MESPLLRQPQPQARRAPAAVAALAVAAVALLSLASLNVHARPFLLQVGEDPEYAAANGEKCWMCPCCAGCESSGAARAAGCSAPGAKTARKEAPVNAAKTSRKQATLHSVADAEPQAAAVAARVQAAAKPAAKPKQVAQAAKTAEVGQVKSSGNYSQDKLVTWKCSMSKERPLLRWPQKETRYTEWCVQSLNQLQNNRWLGQRTGQDNNAVQRLVICVCPTVVPASRSIRSCMGSLKEVLTRL